MKNQQKPRDRFLEALTPETDALVQKFGSGFMALSLAMAFYFSTIEVVLDKIVFAGEETPISVAILELDKKEPEKKETKKPKEKNVKSKRQGQSGAKVGRGVPDAAPTRGVLKILASLTMAAQQTAYTLLNNEQFAKDLSKVLENVSGLKKVGRTEIGARKGTANTDFNSGYTAVGENGIGSMLGSLIGGPTGAISTNAKGKIKPPSSRDIDMGEGTASRSKAEIMRVVRRRSPGLRHIYTKYLKAENGFAGKVTLRFTIAPSGAIISMSKVASTTGNAAFDEEIKARVKGWKFPVIKSGNTTVTIPFTFSE